MSQRSVSFFILSLFLLSQANTANAEDMSEFLRKKRWVDLQKNIKEIESEARNTANESARNDLEETRQRYIAEQPQEEANARRRAEKYVEAMKKQDAKRKVFSSAHPSARLNDPATSLLGALKGLRRYGYPAERKWSSLGRSLVSIYERRPDWFEKYAAVPILRYAPSAFSRSKTLRKKATDRLIFALFSEEFNNDLLVAWEFDKKDLFKSKYLEEVKSLLGADLPDHVGSFIIEKIQGSTLLMPILHDTNESLANFGVNGNE